MAERESKVDLQSHLQLMARQRASDLFLSVGAPAGLRMNGATHYLGNAALTRDEIDGVIAGLLSPAQQQAFAETLEMNLSLVVADIGRYRVNCYRQRGEPAVAIRYISERIPTLEQLHLPALLKDLVLLPRGLVLIVGSTGSGKSTTLAAMIDHRNHTRSGHILTVEEPIEYLHRHDRSIVDQREIGIDTLSYAAALKNAMRESPDVIMIGEIRDRHTMQQAIAYAETGHLCLSTLHANNANQAIDRILNFFPEASHRQVLTDLSLNLQAVVSQRLLPSSTGGRIPAVEILLHSAYVADLIAKGEVAQLKDAMKSARDHGMQTFDQSLFDLAVAGRIGVDTALANADSRNDLQLAFRLRGTPGAGGDGGGMAMEPMEEDEEPKADPHEQWVDAPMPRK